MNASDFPDPLPEPSPDDADFTAPEPDAVAPRSRAVTRIGMTILSEPTVVLTDPPAMLGGHTW